MSEGAVSSYMGGGLAKRLVETLKEVEDRVRGLGRKIRGRGLTHAGFVDGSYVLEERRGACLVLYSASSIETVKETLRQRAKGSRKPVAQILIPKSYSESRAGLLMSMFELLASLDLVSAGAEAVFMDGSYVSALMAPFGFALDVYSRALKAAMEGLDTGVAEELGSEASREVAEIAETGESPRKMFIRALEVIGRYSARLYETLSSAGSPEHRWRKETLDFSVVFFEETAYLTVLAALLRKAEELGAAVFWVAKDSESRYLTEQEGVLGWLNDVMLLDYAWRGMGDIYVRLPGVSFGMPRGCVAYRGVIEEVYRYWNDYTVVYFKFGEQGVVAQMTYPVKLSEDMLDKGLATLLGLSDRVHGYPRPLNYVHNLAVLNPGLARLMADELYRRSGREALVRFMLAPSGRRLLGLK